MCPKNTRINVTECITKCLQFIFSDVTANIHLNSTFQDARYTYLVRVRFQQMKVMSPSAFQFFFFVFCNFLIVVKTIDTIIFFIFAKLLDLL